MSLLLTDEERERFASWLEREVESARGIITQMEKMGPVTAPIIAREKQELAAAVILIRKLRSIESYTVEAAK